MRSLVLIMACLAISNGCTSTAAKYAEGPSCEERQSQLVSIVNKLPDTMLNTEVRVPLPSATLSGSFGKGTILEIDAVTASVNGQQLVAPTLAERTALAASRIAELTGPNNSAPQAGPIYVAASAQLDVRSLHAYLSALPAKQDIRLVFARPASQGEPDPDLHASVYAGKVLTERDPIKRRAIAQAGYDEYSDCQAIDQIVASVRNEPEGRRWGLLRQRMAQAIPSCECSDIDPDGLRQLLVAEQRAGAVALGSVTGTFLSDIRCRATMPLRSVQQILGDIEAFEAEFSGRWTNSELTFDDVVTDERLLTYLCVAMPGEVLESVQREFEQVYVRTASAPECRAFRFEPIARGAPFGTLRPATGASDMAFHYRQGGNEIRIFGPALDGTRPTDDGPWGCDTNLKMSHAENTAVHVAEGGRFYFSEAACRADTTPEAAFKGCTLDPGAKALEPQADPDAGAPSPGGTQP